MNNYYAHEMKHRVSHENCI